MNDRPRPPNPTSPGWSGRALPPIAALRAFDAVARLGGMRRAAEALQIDHAAVSRQVRTLERWTNATLVTRTSNGVALTQIGKAYHQSIAASLDAIAAATLSLAGRHDNARLRIWCVPGFAAQWLAPRIERFIEVRGAEIELHPTEAAPDFTIDQADVHIRYLPFYGAPEPPGPVTGTSVLAQVPVFPVASPSYLATMPPIDDPAALLSHVLIQERDSANWKAWFASYGVPDTDEIRGPRLWHGHLTVDAARRGRGIALANHFLAADDIAAGDLIQVAVMGQPFPPVLFGSYLCAVHPSRRKTIAVTRFLSWLNESLSAELGDQAYCSN